MKILILLVAVLMFSFSTFAQTYEYGKPSELKDKKTTFIDTAADVSARNTIVETMLEGT